MTWLVPMALMAATFLVVFVIIGWQAAALGLRHEAQAAASHHEFHSGLFGFDLRFYAGSMYTLELSDDELRLLRAAIGSCVRDYGHDEADIRRAYQAMLERLPAPMAKVS